MDDPYTLDIAVDWAKRSFGEQQMNNEGTRALRVAEEAIELAQACGVPQETVELTVREVYGRKKGDVAQEIGGVLMTIYLFVRSLGWLFGSSLPGYFFAKELRRVLAKPPRHFADRNAEKIAKGLIVEPEGRAFEHPWHPSAKGSPDEPQ